MPAHNDMRRGFGFAYRNFQVGGLYLPVGFNAGALDAGRTNVFLPSDIEGLKVWYDPGLSTADGNVIDASGEPWVFTSVKNRGDLGGTFASSGGSELKVARIESSNVARQVARGDGSATEAVYSGVAHDLVNSHRSWTWALTIIPYSDGFIYATHQAGAANRGCSLQYDATNARVTLLVSNGTAYCVNQSTSNDSVPLNTTTTIIITYSDESGYQVDVNGSVDTSGALANATDTGDPDAVLYVGSDSGSANNVSANICEFIGIDGTVSQTDRDMLYVYLSAKYQDQNVHSLQAPTFYFDPSVYGAYRNDDANAEPGKQADRIYDLAGNAHDAGQTTDSKQGTFGTDSDGNAEIAVDGTSDCYALAAGAGWPAGTSYSFWFEFDNEETVPHVEAVHSRLLDFQSGRLVLFNITSATLYNAKVGIYDGSVRELSAPVAGEQSLEFHLDDTGNELTGYRNGVFIGSTMYGASLTMGGDVGFCTNYLFAADFLDAAIQQAWARDSLQSDAEIFASRQARATKFPTRWANTLPLVVPVGAAGCWFNTKSAANFVLDGTDIIVAKDCSRQIDDPVSNGDFNTDIAGWSIGNTATLSRETASPYEGAGNLRITKAATWGSATQTATCTTRALFACYYRTDGTATFRLNPGGAGLIDLPAVANWTLAATVVPATSTIQLVKLSATGLWIECDAVEVIPGNHGYQPTSANRPTYDAVNKCATGATNSSLDTGIVAGAAGTIMAWVKSTGGTAAMGCHANATTRCTIIASGANWVANIGNAAPDSGVAISGGWQFITLTWSAGSYTLTVDGTTVSGSYGGAIPALSIRLFCRNLNGADNGYWDGSMSGFQHWPRALSAAEIAYEYALGRNP